MKKLCSIFILFLLPTLSFSQTDVSILFGDGYFKPSEIGEVFLEARHSFKLKEHVWYLTPSVVFVTDGINYQTFPRIGITRYHYNKKTNWDRVTFGLQVYDLDMPGTHERWATTSILSDETWKFRPFLKFTTPIIKLFKECHCGRQDNKSLGEIVIDVTPSTWMVGLGIRKRI